MVEVRSARDALRTGIERAVNKVTDHLRGVSLALTATRNCSMAPFRDQDQVHVRE